MSGGPASNAASSSGIAQQAVQQAVLPVGPPGLDLMLWNQTQAVDPLAPLPPWGLPDEMVCYYAHIDSHSRRDTQGSAWVS